VLVALETSGALVSSTQCFCQNQRQHYAVGHTV